MVPQLVLFDLLSAFDAVDCDILLNIMNCTFGVSGTALNWFSSCLQSRSQRITINGTVSARIVLGPVEFTEYSSPGFHVIIQIMLMTIKHTVVSTLILWIVTMRLRNSASVISVAGCRV